VLFYNDFKDYRLQQKERLERQVNANIPDLGVITKVFAAGDKTKRLSTYSVTTEADCIIVDSLGIVGDRHHSVSHRSSGREGSLYPKGTVIRQHRHLCVVCSYDCRILSENLGVEITPELLGANVLLERSDGEDYSISEIPAGTHMIVFPKESHEIPRPPIATIVHFVKQQGCGVTGNAIAHAYGDKGLVKELREKSKDNRGIICSIEYPVEITTELCAGQQIAFKFPTSIAP